MQAALAQWQNDVGDIGLIPEAEIEATEVMAGSRFAILHGGDDSQKSLQRLVEIATKASQGVQSLDALVAGLSDEDPSVRYWAATGIGNIGVEAVAAEGDIAEALLDPSPSVRIAAARAAARLGHPDEAIEVLTAELQSEHQWGRLAAAIALDEMDEQARPALPALKSAPETAQQIHCSSGQSSRQRVAGNRQPSTLGAVHRPISRCPA